MAVFILRGGEVIGGTGRARADVAIASNAPNGASPKILHADDGSPVAVLPMLKIALHLDKRKLRRCAEL